MANWWENSTQALGQWGAAPNPNARQAGAGWYKDASTGGAPQNAGTGNFFTDLGKGVGLIAPTRDELEGMSRHKIDPNAFQTPGLDDWRKRLLGGADATAARPGISVNSTPQAQFRDAQSGLIGQLQAQARGEGPSQAQLQLNQATDRNLAQALALARTTGQGGGGLRAALNAQAQMSQQAAADSALLRLQEQQAAQNMLGQVAAGARGQDLSLAMGEANAGLQSRQQNDAANQWFLGQGLGLDVGQRGANIGLEELLTNRDLQLLGIANKRDVGAIEARQGVISGLSQAATRAAGF